MPNYNVIVAKSAAKYLKRLAKPDQKAIFKALVELAETPRPQGAEKIQANPAFLRVRCGNYRIIYAVDDKNCRCGVVVIRDRKDAFKGLNGLDAKLAKTFERVADQLLERVPVSNPRPS